MRLIVIGLVSVAVLLPLVSESTVAAASPAILALGLLAALAVAVLFRLGRPPEKDGDGTTGQSDRRFLVLLVLSGFVARVVVAIALRRLGLNQVIAPDELTFHNNGIVFSMWLRGETPYRLSYHHLDSLQVGYFYLVGTIYYLFGIQPILPILLNCLVGSLAAIPVHRIARDLHGREAARTAAILVTFFPSVLLWSTMLLRDSLVVLLLMMIVVGVMELRKRFTLHNLVLLLGLLTLLGTLRQYLFLMVAGTAIASFVLGRTGRTAKSLVVSLLVIVALFSLMKVAGFGVWELERASLFHLNQRRQYNALATAAGSIAPEVDISKPIGALTYLPVGMAYFLGSPFPWQVLSTRQLVALPDVLVWYGLLPSILLGLLHLIRRRFRDASMLLITMTVITILYSLVEGNIGIIFRHRVQVIVPCMVLAGIGLARLRERRAEKLANLPGAAVGAPA
ncbi:MAG: glycosyltransferase family 39 protein [Planctomycetota bacterium]